MTSPNVPSELEPGMLIAGRFRLERLIGRGGMGSVWAAVHLSLGVEVAVKFIDTALGDSQEILSRFAQEAQAAAKIKSPHVVSVLDYGRDQWQRPFIAMELLQGEELSRRADRERTLPLADVARIVTHACRGLSKAHAAGVVHRDLKPENLFLVDDEEGFVVKVLDFGIAKAESPIGVTGHRTGTGQLLGTPTYMSPEQALGNAVVDYRTDLYSLAVVIYRCLTGRVPFNSAGVGELILLITSHNAAPVREARPDVPDAVDVWMRRAMAKDPVHRFASAREMADTFALACAGVAPTALHTALPMTAPRGSRASWATSEADGAHGTLIGSETSNRKGERRGRNGMLVAIGIVVTAVTATGAYFVLGGTGKQAVSHAAAPTISAAESAPSTAAREPPPAAVVETAPPRVASSASSALKNETMPGKNPGAGARAKGVLPPGHTPATPRPNAPTAPRPATDYGI